MENDNKNYYINICETILTCYKNLDENLIKNSFDCLNL